MTSPLTRFIEGAYEQNRPISGQLELTYRCNLLCSFCYNSPQKRTQLDGPQWLTALDKLKAAGVFNITLTGGEPFRHPDFFTIAEGVRERGFVLKTYTNGVDLARRETAERYAALGPFDTEISIHGPTAAIHERLTGVRGSFDKLLVALGHLSELGLKVSLKTPITRLNQQHLKEIEDLGARFGYRVTYDTNLVPTDDGSSGPLELAPNREFLVDFFVDQARRGKMALAPRPIKEMKQVCGVGRTGITIDPYGDIFPCVAWREALGNILEVEALLDLWHGKGGLHETLEQVRRVSEEATTHLAAHPEAVFASFCPANALKETGDPFALYPAAQVSGSTKLEAAERLREEEKTPEKNAGENK